PVEPARQEVEIVAGEETQVTFRHGPPTQEQEQATEGTVEVRVTNATGEPVAACIELSNGEPEAIVVCDDDDDDTDDRPGQIRIEQVPAGPYSVALTELPEGLPDPGTQNIDIEASEIRTVDFTVASGPGTLVIFVENENGERIGGACFSLEGETEALAESLTDVCDQGDDGRLNFPDLPSGDYTIVQTRAGENRELAPEQGVTVEPGRTIEVTVLNPREPEVETPTPEPEATATPQSTPEPVATAEQPVETGMLSVASLGPDGSPLGDGCFVLTDAANVPVAEVCDNDASDFDSAPGVVAFGGIPTGQYTLTQTVATEGFSPAAPVAVEHGVDDTVVEMVNQPATEETGVVELVAFGDDGNPITDQCYTLVGVSESFGPFCDNGEGDNSADPGVLTVERLPVGTYEAVLETAVEDADVEQAQQAKPRRSVSVRGGGRPTRTIFNIRAQQRGDLLIRIRNQDGSYLAGACFALIPNGETTPSAEVCDNRGEDQNSADGRILMTNIRAGQYALTQTTAPTGYSIAADQSVRIGAGSVREVAVTNQVEPERTATLDVETTDGEGNPLPGACYAITRGNSTQEACDDNDDAITRFADIPSGSYVVRQIQPPAGGYTAAGSTATRLDPGQTATVTIVNEARPGSLVLRKTDQAGQLLAGACFALRSGDRAVYSICDNDASDGNTSVGVILLGTVAPGTYTLRETQPPIGYLNAADQEVTISANQRGQISVVNAPAPAPPRTGDLRVFKLDAGGRALAGSCFALVDGEGQVLVPRCDAADGADNGVVLMEGIAPGEYTLRETQPPIGYLSAADQEVTISANQRGQVSVVNA
ncbi:MAG TPA: SpaA isopeptide-forming pilin-related protein, partial [Jiangellaceae bacterium]|nr:SpaA isopeptide-forming pilin-related protein [Jiangellaceae bacterium]